MPPPAGCRRPDPAAGRLSAVWLRRGGDRQLRRNDMLSGSTCGAGRAVACPCAPWSCRTRCSRRPSPPWRPPRPEPRSRSRGAGRLVRRRRRRTVPARARTPVAGLVGDVIGADCVRPVAVGTVHHAPRGRAGRPGGHGTTAGDAPRRRPAAQPGRRLPVRHSRAGPRHGRHAGPPARGRAAPQGRRASRRSPRGPRSPGSPRSFSPRELPSAAGTRPAAVTARGTSRQSSSESNAFSSRRWTSVMW